TAILSLQTDVPPLVLLSSGSLVRFPTRTTRLMFAMLGLLLRRPRGRLRLRRGSVLLGHRLRLGGFRLGRLGLVGAGLGPRRWTTFLALVARALLDRRQRRRRGPAATLDAARGHVPHDTVGDLQDAGDLVQRRRLRVELEQVVRPVGLVVDLVG